MWIKYPCLFSSVAAEQLLFFFFFESSNVDDRESLLQALATTAVERRHTGSVHAQNDVGAGQILHVRCKHAQ